MIAKNTPLLRMSPGVALSLCGLSRKRVLKRLFRLVVVRWANRAHDTRKEVTPSLKPSRARATTQLELLTHK